ncbi:unnamed protein product [Phaedon cochleariae]|uniref:Uncharacterized protein n=1 Tax=Phaedon cochleariae TaxID=80249 RepID=A0A9N9SI59_PHACE|nr:unnamed protein product [Phaedon cochleariae]
MAAKFHLIVITITTIVVQRVHQAICDSDNQYTLNNGGFLFSMPRVLVSGRNESVCISLHEVAIPARVAINLKWKEKHYPTMRHLETEHSCFELYVPRLEIKEPTLVNVKVQVHSSSGSIQSAHNQDPIQMYANEVIKTFIDTDRGTYKPGDKVRFRVLVLNDRLLPISTKIEKIQIINPLDVTVAQWEDVILENGLVSLVYEMVSESLVGKWKIETLGELKSFEVSKYTLPRYKIYLFHPEMIYYKEPSFIVNVCAEYSYGKKVEGLAFIKIFDSHGKLHPIHKLKEMQNGCSEFLITNEELELYKIKEKLSSDNQGIVLHITATVNERGTNRIELTTAKISLNNEAYTMKFKSDSMFLPGLPYNGKLEFHNINVALEKEVVEICYTLAIKKSWNYTNDEVCSNFTIGNKTVLTFNVLPMKNDVIHMNFNARSLNHSNIEDSFLAMRLYSASNIHIHIQRNVLEKAKNECRASQQFEITLTTNSFRNNENITLYYLVKSSSHIYKMRKIKHQVKKQSTEYISDLKNIINDTNVYSMVSIYDKIVIKFKLDKKIISNYQLLVYYVTKTGETIAATKSVDVDPCLMKVEAKWTQNRIVPGSTADLNIETGVPALCSVSSIDKSSKFLSSHHRMIDKSSLLKAFIWKNRETAPSSRRTCLTPEKKKPKAVPQFFASGLTQEEYREKRHTYSFSEDFDAHDVLKSFGSVVITNTKIVTKACYTGPKIEQPNQVQFMIDQYEPPSESQAVSVRSNFPETWLWELVPVSGLVQLKRHLPHAITSWVTNVLCISDVAGIGIANETEITSFQSFFVEILAPYTVKQEETFYLYVHISNYWSHQFPIRISLHLSTGLVLSNKDDKLAVSFCLPENSTASQKFQLKATVIGTVNISVIAKTDRHYPLTCGPETIISRRDTVLKSIIVEPEGYQMKETKSALLCSLEGTNSTNISWNIQVPQDIVPDTYKSHLSLNGDLLGKPLENLGDLLDVPMGCGEQIMASVAPNLYILRYLNSTNILKKSTHQRILRNLKIGYQKILNYVHKDGSFSAFGYHDPMGSMFLTTFVVKILQEAKMYIYVNQRVIDRAVIWIFENQLENGCFNTMLHVFQDMGGTSRENSTAGLTSYVILSLLESNIEVPELVITNAKYCLRGQHNPDKYSMAITCYAMFKMEWYHEANKVLDKLIAVADQQHNMMWWSIKRNTSTASDIETTSYVLLSLLYQNTSENLARALSVVKWLSSKIEAKGSFKSTQDTVVALDALSRYSRLIQTNNLNMRIHIETEYGEQNLTITNSDSLKSKRITLKPTTGELDVNVYGNGCVLVQITQSYYLRQIARSEAFKLAVDVSPVSTIDQCSVTSLSPCLAYTGPDKVSNMAVMEISLPSGYQADRASLYSLVNPDTLSGIKMFEEDIDKVNLYFTKLDKKLLCFSFNINENYEVNDRKESLVKLYDYYNPENQIKQMYAMVNNCSYGNISQIPDISKILAR